MDIHKVMWGWKFEPDDAEKEEEKVFFCGYSIICERKIRRKAFVIIIEKEKEKNKENLREWFLLKKATCKGWTSWILFKKNYFIFSSHSLVKLYIPFLSKSLNR